MVEHWNEFTILLYFLLCCSDGSGSTYDGIENTTSVLHDFYSSINKYRLEHSRTRRDIAVCQKQAKLSMKCLWTRKEAANVIVNLSYTDGVRNRRIYCGLYLQAVHYTYTSWMLFKCSGMLFLILFDSIPFHFFRLPTHLGLLSFWFFLALSLFIIFVNIL